MAAGTRGRLLTSTFIASHLRSLPGYASAPPEFSRQLARWRRSREASGGPAAAIRTIADAIVVPLLRMLGFVPDARTDAPGRTSIALRAGSVRLPAAIVSWDTPLEAAWRWSVIDAVACGAAWALCSNGRDLRIVDARRTWSRQHLEFDLELIGDDEATADVLWSLARADAFAATPALLDVAAAASRRHGVVVCRALGEGVLAALRILLEALRSHRHGTPSQAFEQSLTVLYRVLFLLFAEARGLVPVWHPVYRERYTIDAIVNTLLAGHAYRGIWAAVQAISRMAHSGCRAGELRVNAFNGRLFAPTAAEAFDRARLDDEVMRAGVLAVSTVRDGGVRQRIAYRDLDVEQLGAIYERVLDYAPAGDGALRRGDARKASGTFYTPRALTAAVVRAALEPLLRGRRAAEMLALRVLDPAMGSGAFLVAACRYLAARIESARIEEGVWHPGDVTAGERAALRREIALRCLYGVDLNPTAVQLARLSLWLATLAADRPLTFLDHHLVSGDSLLGATPEDVRRQPSRGQTRGRAVALPLFDEAPIAQVLASVVPARERLAVEPDDSAATVRRKEQALAALRAPGSPLIAWQRVLDLWCAGWFWEGADVPSRGTFSDLAQSLLGGKSALPGRIRQAWLDTAARVAGERRFLHWPLAFPEVFAAADGSPAPNPGFDAVIGNPPWDMVRGDSGADEVREARRGDARKLTEFVRDAGVYRVAPGAHANRYQLFVERAIGLTRRGGQMGLVLPAGILTDAGAAALRRHLLHHADVTAILGFDNRHAIFPIHRSVRFVALTATAGTPTESIACRFGITQLDDLEADSGRRAPVVLTRRFLARLSGDEDLGVPEVSTQRDLAILEAITTVAPPLAAEHGWNVQFGRELNATDDRRAFVPAGAAAGARPVLGGKQIEPFRVSVADAPLALPAGGRAGARVPRRPRLAYRDVASATNRLTLIAAIIPAGCVTTHTLFCLKTALADDAQHVLCALLNSFVANYLIRLRVNTHVTATLMSKLPVPVLAEGSRAFLRLAALAAQLARSPQAAECTPEYAELQALAAHAYGIDESAFAHILETFPLVSENTKARALCLFREGQ